MSLPVYMYEDNYEGRPFTKKMAPQTHARRISFDSLMERPKMHSRAPSMAASIDSSVSSLSSSRNKLQKKRSRHFSSPASWSHSAQQWSSQAGSPTNKPLPSLPIWQTRQDARSEEEYRQRVAYAEEMRAEMARREKDLYEQGMESGKSSTSTRPSMPDFGDSWVMDRPGRRGTIATKKGWKFYREVVQNWRERKKSG